MPVDFSSHEGESRIESYAPSEEVLLRRRLSLLTRPGANRYFPQITEGSSTNESESQVGIQSRPSRFRQLRLKRYNEMTNRLRTPDGTKSEGNQTADEVDTQDCVTFAHVHPDRGIARSSGWCYEDLDEAQTSDRLANLDKRRPSLAALSENAKRARAGRHEIKHIQSPAFRLQEDSVAYSDSDAGTKRRSSRTASLADGFNHPANEWDDLLKDKDNEDDHHPHASSYRRAQNWHNSSQFSVEQTHLHEVSAGIRERIGVEPSEDRFPEDFDQKLPEYVVVRADSIEGAIRVLQDKLNAQTNEFSFDGHNWSDSAPLPLRAGGVFNKMGDDSTGQARKGSKPSLSLESSDIQKENSASTISPVSLPQQAHSNDSSPVNVHANEHERRRTGISLSNVPQPLHEDLSNRLEHIFDRMAQRLKEEFANEMRSLSQNVIAAVSSDEPKQGLSNYSTESARKILPNHMSSNSNSSQPSSSRKTLLRRLSRNPLDRDPERRNTTIRRSSNPDFDNHRSVKTKTIFRRVTG